MNTPDREHPLNTLNTPCSKSHEHPLNTLLVNTRQESTKTAVSFEIKGFSGLNTDT